MSLKMRTCCFSVGGRCWLKCISSGTSEEMAASRVMLCVDVVVLHEKEHRGDSAP
jgi:hypothetical protein